MKVIRLTPLTLSALLLFTRKTLLYPHAEKQVITAKTPNAIVGVEGEDARMDNRYASSPPSPPASASVMLKLRLFRVEY